MTEPIKKPNTKTKNPKKKTIYVTGQVKLPGDPVEIDSQTGDDDDKAWRTSTVLGPGLYQLDEDTIVAIKPGVLAHRDPDVYWIDSHQKRYVAAKGDCVIGIVVDATGDVFRIDIGTSEHASLSYVAFEGATKRNRPNVKIGDLVYARLLVASRGTQPELVCIDGKGKSSGMGVLQEGGYIVYTSSSHARRLLEPDCSLLRLLGNPLPYEVAVGLNGRIWIKGRSIKETLELANLITHSEHWSVDELKRAIKRLANSLAGF